jgi:TolB-like protein/Tfp pilus assembly protein PilF
MVPVSFFAELKRRNVVRVGIAYAVTTWILLQLTDVVAEILKLPEWAPKLILLILLIGFVPALIFAWAFEMTPEGLKREKDVDRGASIMSNTGRKLDYTIIGLLALGMAYFVWESRFQKGSESFSQQPPEKVAGVRYEKRALTPIDDASDKDKSIAVLPFTNRSPNADDAYFTDGVHDDLLTQLAKIDAFSVISRTSVMEYRDTAKNLKQIGEELGVANIMEGAVQRAGNRVRINVQLIDAGSDEHLWAEVYDRELTTGNLFDIQSEIAKAIAGALQATLSTSEIASVSDVPTGNVAAYELYLQGNRFSLGETEIGFDTSVELYKEALKLDPDFKLAWIGLAKAYINNYWSYGGNPADRDETRKAIDKARAIDADFPELYMAEGFYHYWGLLDYDTALLNLEKAITLMPGNADAHMWKGWASRRAGLWEQAIDSMQKALKLSPRVVINLIETGQTLSYLGRYDEAMVMVEKAYELEPDNYWSKTYLADMVLLVSGDTGRATTLLVGAQHTNDMSFVYPYWHTQMMAGQFDTALQIAQTWSADWEINREIIFLREELMAKTLKAMGRDADARKTAGEALERLEKLKQQGLDDYRVLAAELNAYGILGDTLKVAELAKKVLSSKPADVVEDMNIKYRFAQSYAYADMPDESIATLDLLLSGYSAISAHSLELDPAFNSIRNTPEFIALLERHR